HQRIQQRLKRNGLAGGPKCKRSMGPRVPRTCPICKNVEWVPPHELAEQRYCSRQCAAAARSQHQRRIPEAAILKALELREAGWAWGRIEAELGWPWQSLLRRIWLLLAERGELTEARAVELLRDCRDRRHQPRWGWLSKRTGLRPERSEPLAEAA